MKKGTYTITGMTCDGCKSNVESMIKSIASVKSAEVLLAEGSVEIEFAEEISFNSLKKLFEEKGNHYKIYKEGEEPIIDLQGEQDPLIFEEGTQFYCPMHCEGDKKYEKQGDCPVCGMDLVPVAIPGSNTQSNDLLKRLQKKLIIAVVFTLPIFLIEMIDMLPSKPLSSLFSHSYWNWIQFALSIPVVFYATWMFFERAWSSIRRWNLNMFTLIGIGAGAAWIFSLVSMIFPQIFPDQFRLESGSVPVYFEAATVILTLVLVGQVLEARAHNRTNNSIKALLNLAPKKATKIIMAKEVIIDISHVKKGDVLRVKPGESIPVDGTIIKGDSYVDESMISGEPIPVFKKRGDHIIAGTLNQHQTFDLFAEKVGSETVLAKIIELVNHASMSRAPIQRLADQISKYFVPIVVLISVITFIIWSIFGPSPAYAYAFINAVAVLIIACPCALGLATPMSVMVGIGKGAQSGVLIKEAASLEKLNQIDTLVLDKTGTLTEGRPVVKEIGAIDSKYSDHDLINFVFSLNRFSEHPIAKACVEYGNSLHLIPLPVSEFKAIPGKGVIGLLKNKNIGIGNRDLNDHKGEINEKHIEDRLTKIQEQGNTVSFIYVDEIIVGYLIIHDPIKEGSAASIKYLIEKGVDILMLTGDNVRTAKYVADKLGISDVKAECKPEDKLNYVQLLKDEGKVVAVAGDGINDAPALSLADIGIAMGDGTDIAMESATITLLKGDISGIVRAYKLSNSVVKNIKQNLFFALIYNSLGVPLAAGALFPFFGILLSPMIAALAMSFSSVSVIGNALRLQRLKL